MRFNTLVFLFLSVACSSIIPRLAVQKVRDVGILEDRSVGSVTNDVSSGKEPGKNSGNRLISTIGSATSSIPAAASTYASG